MGDKFVYESTNVLKEFFRLENYEPENDDQLAQKPTDGEAPTSYIARHYDVEVFASQGSKNSRSTLGRLRNIIVTALQEYDKFPKYILIILEEDLIHCINFNKSGISEIYGQILK